MDLKEENLESVSGGFLWSDTATDYVCRVCGYKLTLRKPMGDKPAYYICKSCGTEYEKRSTGEPGDVTWGGTVRTGDGANGTW